mgnify:CR=1 FL=1
MGGIIEETYEIGEVLVEEGIRAGTYPLGSGH